MKPRREPAALKAWALAGLLLGALFTLALQAPAAWLAALVAGATGQRLLLADARGTVWNGNAVLVLTGGADSRDASALPDRLHWRLRPQPLSASLALSAKQACCLNGELHLRMVLGLGRLRVELPAGTTAGSDAAVVPPSAAAPVGQWPAAWLSGLGTPWNTLQPTGLLQLHTAGAVFEQVQGRWQLRGRLEFTLARLASRLSTLDSLGSYRLALAGDAAAGPAQLQLSTLEGALQLSGSGQLLGAGSASRLRFTGQASAGPGFEAALGNLLNIIGRRQGAFSVISIG